MKATRLQIYNIPNYGQILFSRRQNACHVVWTTLGGERGTPIAWLPEGEKQSAKMAVFYAKMACSIEDGFDPYHYHDKGLVPPRKGLEPVEMPA
jgi:hypothetical protein